MKKIYGGSGNQLNFNSDDDPVTKPINNTLSGR